MESVSIPMKLKAISLVSMIVLVAIVSSPALLPTVEAQAQEISDVKVLMLISDYFGWNYFDAKEIFESWGVNVTTIANSLDTDVPSCSNKPARGTTADLLLNQVENNIVTQFNVLVIPAGAQWQNLIQSNRVLEFIQYAHDNGVIVAAICIGNIVLSHANGIVNGSSVVSYPNTNIGMTIAGATIRTGYCAVTDNRFITGGTGGGPTGGGYEIAPTSEVCFAAVREALGFSFFKSANISPQTGAVNTNFTITVEVADLDTELGSISLVDCNISEVNAQIYTKVDRTLVDTIQLVDDNDDGVYSGEFTSVSNGEYVVDIEIEDTNNTLSVEREPLDFSVGGGFAVDPLTLGIIATCSLIVMVAIIIVKKR
jgi:putative intracellular protease/amidase